MAYSNSDILAAILNKFLQPIVVQFAQAKMSAFPFVQTIENKVKASGWVSSNWSLTQELSPLIEPISGSLVKPMIRQYLSSVPDDAIPEMAHGLVDKAIQNGGLNLMEGRLKFDTSDLQELKNLLNYNLPISKENEYEVLMSPPNKESDVSDGTAATTH